MALQGNPLLLQIPDLLRDPCWGPPTVRSWYRSSFGGSTHRLVTPQVVTTPTFNKPRLGKEGTILFWLVLDTEWPSTLCTFWNETINKLYMYSVI